MYERWPAPGRSKSRRIRTDERITGESLDRSLVSLSTGAGLPIYVLRETLACWSPLPADLSSSLSSVARASLSAQGRSLLIPTTRSPTGSALHHDRPTAARTIRRLSFATQHITELPFTSHGGAHSYAQAAERANNRDVAIVERWLAPTPAGMPAFRGSRLTVLLVSIDGGPATELATLVGRHRSEADDASVQWSPNGQLLAVSTSQWEPNSSEPALDCTLLFDAKEGWRERKLSGYSLAGSCSFNQDNTLLLLRNGAGDICLHNLSTGDTDQIPGWPNVNTDGDRPGVPRVLGFGGRNHLIAATQRGRTMQFYLTSLDATLRRALFHWTGSSDMYPTIASTSESEWERLAA